MKSHVQAAIIGGGVVGCSVLFHLTKLGWKDVMLIERSELTSGSTWHAAGGFHTLNADTNMAALQGYTIQLYKELEALSGQSCGLHHVGGLTIATSPDRRLPGMLFWLFGSMYLPSGDIEKRTVQSKPRRWLRIFASMGQDSSERYSSSPAMRTMCFPW